MVTNSLVTAKTTNTRKSGKVVAGLHNEVQVSGDNISELLICEKALEIYDNLIKKKPGKRDNTFEFKASRRWFKKFKNRSKIDNVIRHGEAASSNKKAAEKFIVEFNDMIKKEGYLLQQVFNADEQRVILEKDAKQNLYY